MLKDSNDLAVRLLYRAASGHLRMSAAHEISFDSSLIFVVCSFPLCLGEHEGEGGGSVPAMVPGGRESHNTAGGLWVGLGPLQSTGPRGSVVHTRFAEMVSQRAAEQTVVIKESQDSASRRVFLLPGPEGVRRARRTSGTV
jgi:hypothetical protein